MTVYLEEGIPEETVQGLRKMGHHVEVLKEYDRSMFGRGQIIRCHKEDGKIIYSGGSDLRGDGCAMPV
jgi:gamma-glutamyltranspeptidase/glutathione hydrolase